MKKYNSYAGLLFLFFVVMIIWACNGQNALKEQVKNSTVPLSTQTAEIRASDKRVDYRADQTVKCGLQDSKGVLWFGTITEGVYRYDTSADRSSIQSGTTNTTRQGFTNIREADGLCDNNVNAIIEDRAGNLWFGTAEGLCFYDGKTFTQIPIPWSGNETLWGEGMNDKHVLSLIQDKKGNIWFGTWGGGAYRFDPAANSDTLEPEPIEVGGIAFTSFLANEGRVQADGLHRNVIQSILEDREGNIWFTSMTHGGVSRYNPSVLESKEAITHFSLQQGLSDDMIRTCFQDRAGHIWFGALGNRNGGLDRYDQSASTRPGEKLFTNFHVADGLSSGNVLCIYEDKSGKLWIGSDRGSLSVYDPSPRSHSEDISFTTFRTKEGQSFDRINFVMEDAKGNIWFGGNYGQLFRYNPLADTSPNDIAITDFTQKGRG